LAVGLKLQASGKDLVMKDFKKLMIWQLGMEIVDKVYDLTSLLPADERFGIRSQMTRSATSIPGNIAEGSAKRSSKDYLRFVEIAFGSAFELETHALIVQRRKWVADELVTTLLELIRKEQRMLAKFIEKLGG
jgi:four helix bundle protein